MLHYHLLLADLDIVNTRRLSAAGAFGAQQWTPAFDAETIVYGTTHTQMPADIQPVLQSGALSPAILVHHLLSAIHLFVEPVHIHIHNLGLNHAPAIGLDSLQGWGSVTYYDHRLPPMELEPWLQAPLGLPTFMEENLHSALRLEAGDIHNTIARQRELGHDVIIAECVPGGTTTAGIWWRFLSGDEQPTPSSASHRTELEIKEHTVNQFLEKARDVAGQWFGHPDNRKRDTFTVIYQNVADRFQQVLLPLLIAQAGEVTPTPEVGKLILGGGVQIGAVLLAMKYTDWGIYEGDFASRVEWWSTPWIAKGWPPASTMPQTAPIQMQALPHFSLGNALHEGLRPYEQGFVKEGLGLGAVLGAAYKRLGCTERELADLLDELCHQHEQKTYGRRSALRPFLSKLRA